MPKRPNHKVLEKLGPYLKWPKVADTVIKAQLCTASCQLTTAYDPARGDQRPGSAKVWQPCTPAMAAGLTDHGWSLREVLLFRVPPWPQPYGA
jgi:hypothetical protein